MRRRVCAACTQLVWGTWDCCLLHVHVADLVHGLPAYSHDSVMTMAFCVLLQQVLSTPTDTLQQLVDKLLGLGMDHSSVQQFLWEFPGMMADYREEQLPLVVRMVDSRRNKYTNGGTYID